MAAKSSVIAEAKGSTDMIKKIMLKDLNPHVICPLCRGYFIDPVTIMECLHSFCKTCILKHIQINNRQCPTCDKEIHKTKPTLGMKADKALQNIVYKLVPGLYQEEMQKRKIFTQEHEPTKVPKAELEKHFFFCHDNISMSLEYYDNESKSIENNPNKRYLACPGTVKIQHLMKFIVMKYGLNEEQFVVDVIYNGDIIPEDYTLIDVAYYYKWAKDSPMKFFYRIFKKNKVLLKRRKRKSRTEDKIPDPKKSRPVEVPNNNNNNTKTDNSGSKENIIKENGAAKDASKSGSKEIVNGCRAVHATNPPSLQDETAKKVELSSTETAKDERPPPVLKKAEEPSKMEIDDSSSSDEELKIDLSEGAPSTMKSEGVKKEEKEQEKKKEAPPTLPLLTKEEPKSSEAKPVTDKAVIKPKLTVGSNGQPVTTSNANKPRSNHNMLTDIVNNLAKKQASTLSNKTKSETTKPVSTLLGGQTTITKKEPSLNKEPSGVKEAEKKKRENPKTTTTTTPKGIPSGTSVTVRSMSSSSSTSASAASTTTVSFSNSFKSKNGSMMDFVQSNNSSSSSSNGLSPTKKSSTLSDLRQFRKDSNGGSKTSPSSNSSSARSPIIPSLTLGKVKSSPTNASSTSSALSKPIPKASCLPPSVTSANSFFAAQAAAAAALAGLDPTNQLHLLRTFASMSPALSLPHPLLSNNQQQLPASRLKLVQTSSSGSTAGSSSLSSRIPPSLASHIAPESQWKMFSSAMSNGSSNGSSGNGKLSSYTKALNQSIRQIPNPSLLTKQANSDQSQQSQLLQRAMQAAAASAVAARTPQ